MVLEYENGRKLTIYLDQGMGYWRTKGRAEHFNFDGDMDMQAKDILDCTTLIEGNNNHETYIVIKVDD